MSGQSWDVVRFWGNLMSVGLRNASLSSLGVILVGDAAPLQPLDFTDRDCLEKEIQNKIKYQSATHLLALATCHATVQSSDLGVRMYIVYAALSHRPKVLIRESCRPNEAAVVATPILKLCPTEIIYRGIGNKTNQH